MMVSCRGVEYVQCESDPHFSPQPTAPGFCGWYESILVGGESNGLLERYQRGPIRPLLYDSRGEYPPSPHDVVPTEETIDVSDEWHQRVNRVVTAYNRAANSLHCADKFCPSDKWIDFTLPTTGITFDTSSDWNIHATLQGYGYVTPSDNCPSNYVNVLLPDNNFALAHPDTAPDGRPRAVRDLALMSGAMMNETFPPVGIVEMPGWKINYGQDPHQGSDIMTLLFLPLVLSFLLPVMMYHQVAERQSGLRFMMAAAGLDTSSYWTVTYLYFYGMFLGMAIVLCSVGAAFGTHFFKSISPGIFIPLILLSGSTVVSLAFFLSCLFTKSNRATGFGYAVSILSSIAIFFLNMFVWSKDDFPPGMLVWPIFAFSRGIFLCVRRLMMGYDMYYDWPTSAEANDGLAGICITLAVETVVLLFAAIYIDAVMPRTRGVPQHPLFPIYWLMSLCAKKQKSSPEELDLRHPLLHEPTSTTVQKEWNEVEDAEDGLVKPIGQVDDPTLLLGRKLEDVIHERERVEQIARSGEQTQNIPVLIKGLSKVYQPSWWSRKSATRALDDLWLGLDPGACFGLLGPNGAGKTTLVHLLCGMFSPSSGDAMIGGHSLASDLQEARAMLGFCPQFDILFDGLGVRDHVLLYARLRGLSVSDEREHANSILVQVGLQDVPKRVAGALSGGMARRLSLACALAGSPPLILMDEPTTGLDPSSRRGVWDIVAKIKEGGGSSILLTTHSMEEADVLADRVGILRGGKLVCVDTTMRLKNRIGGGYSLNVSCDVSCEDRVKQFVEEVVPSAMLRSSFAGTMIFALPRAGLDFSDLFERMENDGPLRGVQHWAISAETLEAVFLAIVRQDEAVGEDFTPEVAVTEA